MIGGGRSASHQSNSMRKSSNKPATGSNVTWRGFTARYTPAELEFMRRLKRWPEEAAFVHEAKARFGGRLK